jgi:drug/metabolite transporter (DMT)-like permease
LSVSDFLEGRKGEAAALATAVCWSLTPFFFTAASRRIGAFAANVIRLAVALCLLDAAVLVTGAASTLPWRQAALLAASGLVGLSLGDAALFEAFVALGPRRVSLLSATAPIFVAVVSVPVLGETISPMGMLGMALTLGGVAWVVMERGDAGEVRGSLARGVTMGVVAAAGQGFGAILAKAGLGAAPATTWLGGLAADGAAPDSVSPLLGTLVRMLAGTLGMVGYAAMRGKLGEVVRGARDARAVAQTAGGAMFGPFVGMWFSLAAFKYTKQTAVAQTIMAFSPVLVIAIARVVHGERPSPRAWIGSIGAVFGLAVLAFREEIARAFGG